MALGVMGIVAVDFLLAARSTRADGPPLPDQAQGHLGSSTAVVDGPPSPVAPAVVARDEAGRATVRAVALDRPLQVDGVLDEDVYESIPSIGDFIQQVPKRAPLQPSAPRRGSCSTPPTSTWRADAGIRRHRITGLRTSCAAILCS